MEDTCVMWEIKVLFSFTVFHNLHSRLVMLQSPIKIAKWKGRIFPCFPLDGFCVSRGSDSAATGSRLVCFHCSLSASTWFSSSHLISEAEITASVKLLGKEKLLVDMALTGGSLPGQIHGNSTGWACWVWTQGAAALVHGKMLLLRSGFLWLLNLTVMWPNNVISLWTIQIIGKTFHHSKMQFCGIDFSCAREVYKASEAMLTQVKTLVVYIFF